MSHVRDPGALKSQGFSLIELMVATAIFAFGMLALAALQGNGLQFNSNAYLRSQAVFFAYDMTDRMRANIAGVDANAYSAMTAANVPSPAVSCVAVNPVCSAAVMATADQSEWYASLAAALPNGTGSVTCNDSDAGADADACTDGSPHTISITWDGRFWSSTYTLQVIP